MSTLGDLSSTLQVTMLLVLRTICDTQCVCSGLLAGVAARAKRPEYAQLLADCQRLYCEVRLGLVSEIVTERIADFAREPLPSLTRSGCSYLMQVLLLPPNFHNACFTYCSMQLHGADLSHFQCFIPVVNLLSWSL